jgi:hypothetical protein
VDLHVAEGVKINSPNMLFVRNIKIQSQYKGRKDLQKHIQRYDFTRYVYKDKTVHLRNLNNDDKYFIPDLAASVIQQIFLNGYQAKGTKDCSFLTEDALECCRDIIENIGFKNVVDREFLSILHDGNGIEQTIMIIAGCQNPEMLKQRVRKAVTIAKDITCKLSIIFSGENPSIKGFDDIEIFSEAERMEMYFKEFWETDPPNSKIPSSICFVIEKNSHNTKSNIQNCIKGGFIDTKQSMNFIIVSSTFHLIRLATEFENTIMSMETTLKIENLLLAGSENSSYPLKPNDEDAAYVKLMFADIFYYIFNVTKNITKKSIV